MTSPIDELYNVKNGGDLPQKLCTEINKALAVIELDDIPQEQHENVAEYLVNALNHESVDKGLVPALDKLLSQLQEIPYSS